jgi:hypothetical protein
MCRRVSRGVSDESAVMYVDVQESEQGSECKVERKRLAHIRDQDV